MPEIAARAHLDHLDGLIAGALDEAGIGFDDLDGVAATGGPGLIGGVIVGRDDRQGDRAGARPAASSRSITSKAMRCRARLADGLDVSLSAAAGLRRPLPAPRRRGRRPLSPPRHHHRRRRRRGLRQDRQAAGPGLSRRAGDRARRRGRGDRDALCPAAPDEGPPGLRLLVLRPQDGGPPARRDGRTAPLAAQRRRRPRRRRSRRPSATCWSTARANAIAAVRRRAPGRAAALVVAGGVAANEALRGAARGAGRPTRLRARSRRRCACAPTTPR